MEIILLTAIAGLLIILIVAITLFSKRAAKQAQQEQHQQQQQEAGGAGAVGRAARRAAGVRGARQRRGQIVGARNEQQQHQLRDADEPEAAERPEDEATGEAVDLSKLGTKKRAKLEAKAERKAQREVEEHEREERKRREQQKQEDRDRESAREREEERRLEEAERAAREERARREHAEYLRLREAFSVEEEGYDEDVTVEEGEESARQQLRDFIDYIERNKVVLLEDLARHFGLRAQAAIDRVQELQADGRLSGVLDDRGKFIHVPRSELEAVARFVRQRGRVTIAELVEHSNSLINLNPSLAKA